MYSFFLINPFILLTLKNKLKLIFFNKVFNKINYKTRTKYNKLTYYNYKNFYFFFSKLFKKNNFKKNNFYFLNLFNNNIKNIKEYGKYNYNIYNFGLNSLFIFIKFIFISIIILMLIVYFSIIIKSLSFSKVIFSWVCIIMFIYWLISGFVFFFKKYQFGKYTSVIQRFWKRTYILFWLIEGATFSAFLFFTINASQESIYMFDQISIFKTHLYSWRLFFLKLFPTTLLIMFIYFILLSIKYNFYSKYSIFLFFITFFLTNLVWLEFYQFYHVINFYSNLNWNFDQDENFWILEQDPRRTRIVNNYVMILFILKFWHIVFIYGFWIFFVLRSNEIKRIKYSLLAANYQNAIILYIFTWVFMYPWFKFFFKNLIDSPYYWFYINNRKLFLRIFLNDFKLYIYCLNKINLNIFYKFINFNFYYNININNSNFEGFKKNLISNKIINSI